MTFLEKFAELMKSELFEHSVSSKRHVWSIDETKCLAHREVGRLRRVALLVRDHGLFKKRFALIRSWFVVELGLESGLRVDEMANLKCSDLLIGSEKSSLIVRNGKGSKRRSVWISSVFKRTCKEFLEYRRQFGFEIEPEGFVLCNRWGQRISTRALQKDFKALIKKTNLPERYHIHSLRHTYTTFLLLASNNNYRFAQIQLGHSSIKTTQEYAGVVEREARKALEKMY